MQTLLENLFEAAILANLAEWRVSYANPKTCHWLARTPSAICGSPLTTVLALTPPLELLPQLERIAGNPQQTFAGTGELLIAEGQSRQVDVQMCQVEWDGQPHIAVLLRPRSVASGDRTQLPLSAVPFERSDPLTGLADRAFLMSRLNESLSRSPMPHSGFALLFIDLDNFKQVNDANGHLIGDRVLREVADRLRQCVRADDEVFRYGGDEFVVLVAGVVDADETKLILDRIRTALAAPIALPDGNTTLAVSIGVAMASPSHRTPEDLLAEADRAMYASKREGR